MYSVMHLKVLPCQPKNVKEIFGGEEVSFVLMEQTQQTTISLCLLKAIYPFNSSHSAFQGRRWLNYILCKKKARICNKPGRTIQSSEFRTDF